jgi:threonine/homoserine/homoserine lactone efflux protein
MSVAALAAIFGTSFVVGLTGALSPGPLVTVAMREGAQRGFWAGPVLAAGHSVIELGLVIGLALGLNQLLDSDAVTATVALAGGAFLVWMGATTALQARHTQFETERDAQLADGGVWRASVAGPLALAGIVVSLSNPFWLAWWATIGTAYIVQSLDEGVLGVSAFYGGHILADIGWLSVVAFAVAGGRRVMSRRVYQGLLAVCGVFLVGLGSWFLASGIGYAT